MDDLNYTQSTDDGYYTFSGSLPQNLVFNVGGAEVVKLCENGDIYVKGRLIENDAELVDGMREFLRLAKIERDGG